MMARSGCRALFVGLESFNPATLADMRKHQNVIHKMRSALDYCRKHGILIVSGLMVSPLTRFAGRHSQHSGESGPLRTCMCRLSSPSNRRYPARPISTALGRETHPPAFMPNVLLRDLAGYTLAVKPRKSSVDEFIAAYREVTREVFSAATATGQDRQ